MYKRQLVEPLDGARALDLLQDPLAHLPLPNDSARFLGGALVVEEDPWWEELRDRLVAADTATDWDQVFLRDLRAGDAAKELLGEDFIATSDAWTLKRRGGAVVAARKFTDGTRVLSVDEFGLAQSVRGAMDDESSEPFLVRFGPELESPFETVLPERRLGGGLLSFTCLLYTSPSPRD